MKIADFVAEFEDEHFPSEVGPSIGVEDHDPPFTLSQLRSMEKRGLILLGADCGTYRLTLKATRARAAGRKELA